MKHVFGIDIGGSGIKGAPVNLKKGEMSDSRYRITTPKPPVPKKVARVVAKIARKFDWTGPIGCTFPGIIKNGIVHSAANLDPSWIGVNGQEWFEEQTGTKVRLINDADAAGLAEMKYGAGRKEKGVVILLTFGTGIGSAVFNDGTLVPNTEFGHLKFMEMEAEEYASDRARKRDKLTWKKWATRMNEYLNHLDFIFSPDLIIIGGGVSNKPERFQKYVKTPTRVVPASLGNNAGIVGAALWAKMQLKK